MLSFFRHLLNGKEASIDHAYFSNRGHSKIVWEEFLKYVEERFDEKSDQKVDFVAELNTVIHARDNTEFILRLCELSLKTDLYIKDLETIAHAANSFLNKPHEPEAYENLELSLETYRKKNHRGFL